VLTTGTPEPIAITKLTEEGDIYSVMDVSGIVGHDLNEPKPLFVALGQYLGKALDSLKNYLALSQSLGATNNWHVGLSLLNARQVRFLPHTDWNTATVKPAQAEHVRPDLTLIRLNDNWKTTDGLRLLMEKNLKRIWQSVGYPGVPIYGPEGQFIEFGS
jgi:hypothetical protein